MSLMNSLCERATIDVLMAGESSNGCRSLRKRLEHMECCVRECQTLSDVRCALQGETSTGVIFTDTQIADGTWQDVLAEARRRRPEPSVIVTADRIDPFFWARALELGAFEAFVRPWSGSDLQRLVSTAYARWVRTLQIYEERAKNLRQIRS